MFWKRRISVGGVDVVQFTRMGILKTVAIVLIFAGALFVLWSHQPEQVFSRSADGVVTVRGVSRNVRSATIEPSSIAEAIFPARVGEYYLVIPNPSGIIFSSELSIQIIEQWKQLQPDLMKFSLYRFDEASRTWQKLPTVVDLQKGIIQTEIDLSGPTWIVVGAE